MLSVLVREHLHEITEWRALGTSWSEINELIAGEALNHPPASVRTLYHLELARRRSPKRIAAIRWANTNYDLIKDLLDKGCSWIEVPIILPLDLDNAPTPPLNMLISEFKAIEKVRTAHQSGDSTPPDPASQPMPAPQPRLLTMPTSTTDTSHVLARAPEAVFAPIATIPDIKAPHEPAIASNQATEARDVEAMEEAAEEAALIERKVQQMEIQQAERHEIIVRGADSSGWGKCMLDLVS